MTSTPQISVLTLNVWNREGDWAARLPLLREGLRQLQPDLIGFQEVKDPQQLDELMNGLGYQTQWLGGSISGIALASRFDLSQRAELWLPGDAGKPGGVALRARAHSPAGPISLCCATTFFFMNHQVAKRERQMPELAKFAYAGAEPGGFPALLVGDFNTDPESSEVRFLKGQQSLDGQGAYFCDAWQWGGDGGHGATWCNRNPNAAVWQWPDRRIDYVFAGHPRLDGAGRIERCRVVFDQPHNGVWPSDHLGVLAALRGM